MYLNESLKVAHRFVLRNFSFLVTMLLLNLPVLTIRQTFGKALHYFLYMCFAMTCLAAVIELLPRTKARNMVQRTLIGLSVMLLIINLYFAYYYGGFPDQAIIEVLLATTAAEVWGYVKANLLDGRLYVVVMAGLVLFYGIERQIIRLKRKPSWVGALSVLLIGAGIFTTANIIKDIIKHKDKTLRSLTYQSCSVISTGKQLCDAVENMQKFTQMMNGGTSHPAISSNESTIPYVVYILGESTSRHHLGLYGYHLDTTPCMSALEENGELYKFTDVISPNSSTIPVLEKLFTFYRKGAKGDWYQYTDLFSILNVAGYHTVWLSNQEYTGIYGYAGRFYAERCKVSAFTQLRNSESATIQAPFDEALLPLLDRELRKAAKKNFIVVHLYGTHQHYKDRYPATFRAFTPDEEEGESSRIRQTRAEYDTAIRYNDSIINAIIRRFERKNAIVIYAPDHAEDVLHVNKKIAGHGEIGVNRFMVEIPMMIYTSKKFREAYPDLDRRMCQAVNRPFMTDDMIHALLDLMQIKTPGYKPAYSVFNQQYNAARIRYCGGKPYRKKRLCKAGCSACSPRNK